MNISDVKFFKIHPSIGVARIANNDDYFEFFEAHSKNFYPPQNYMSKGGVSDIEYGKLRIKRQAVQFTIFAYGQHNELLGKVDDLFPDIEVKWSGNVGNRKLYNYSKKKGSEIIAPIMASATANRPEMYAELNGKSPWDDQIINLGIITGKGLYIPPKGGVTRRCTDSQIDRYPADAQGTLQCIDTSCDGQISAVIINRGNPIPTPIIPAWVVAAPGKHALTLNPVITDIMRENFGDFLPTNNNANSDWLKATSNMLGIDGEIYDPTGLDVPMMATLNADYNPGMEVNLSLHDERIENGVIPKDFFYTRDGNYIDNKEIRIKRKEETNGTIPGQLTSGLCSTWQGDMSACLNYWTAENPNKAYDLDNEEVIVIYKEDNPNVMMSSPEEINTYMDFRGIVDYQPKGDDIRLNLVYDPNRRRE